MNYNKVPFIYFLTLILCGVLSFFIFWWIRSISQWDDFIRSIIITSIFVPIPIVVGLNKLIENLGTKGKNFWKSYVLVILTSVALFVIALILTLLFTVLACTGGSECAVGLVLIFYGGIILGSAALILSFVLMSLISFGYSKGINWYKILLACILILIIVDTSLLIFMKCPIGNYSCKGKLWGSEGDIEKCEYEAHDNVCRTIAARTMAINKKDPNICRVVLKSDEEINTCLMHYAIDTKNPKVCNMLPETNLNGGYDFKETCFRNSI